MLNGARTYILMIIVFLSAPTSGLSGNGSLGHYLTMLNTQTRSGGMLNCKTSSDLDRQSYRTCETFSALREQGCYGNSTQDIFMESRYEFFCEQKAVLKNAKETSVHYFDLKSADWWKLLPAEIIPMPGGIHSEESLEIARRERIDLVSGKKLGELAMLDIVGAPSYFSANISIRKETCGQIRDEVTFQAATLADFDNDGVAELLVIGYRLERSETCLLGSGNDVGGHFFKVIEKPSVDDQFAIIAGFP